MGALRYVLQKYSTGEYHIFEMHWNHANGRWNKPKNGAIPLCNNENVGFDVQNPAQPGGGADEDEMAVACATKETYVRHMICARCVGHFYKTPTD